MRIRWIAACSIGLVGLMGAADDEMPAPHAAPVLVGTLEAGNAVRLTWSAAETGTTRFRLEWRAGDDAFLEPAYYDLAVTETRIGGLNAGTAYTFRLRSEFDNEVTPWSNEVLLLTAPALPPAPSNVRGVPVSTSEVELSWTNNAPDATLIHVEMRALPGGLFVEVAPAAELTRTRITGLAPATSYVFRTRAEAPRGLSVYSNEATVTTLASTQPRSVFLIHGIGQDPSDLARLRFSLAGPSGIDPARFSIDSTFDWSECASRSCPSNCSLGETAERLAAHVLTRAPGDVVLVALGAGGMVARELIGYNRGGILTQRRVAGLVTLGTPNLGYPYVAADETLGCPQLLRDLRSDFRVPQRTGRAELSSYLETLFGIWAQRQYPGGTARWLAVSGRSCNEAIRRGGTSGCRDRNPESDGAICDDSAVYSVATRAGATPSQTWRDPQRQYSRADGLVSSLCPADARTLPLSDPPVGSSLFGEIRRFINGL